MGLSSLLEGELPKGKVNMLQYHQCPISAQHVLSAQWMLAQLKWPEGIWEKVEFQQLLKLRDYMYL